MFREIPENSRFAATLSGHHWIDTLLSPDPCEEIYVIAQFHLEASAMATQGRSDGCGLGTKPPARKAAVGGQRQFFCN